MRKKTLCLIVLTLVASMFVLSGCNGSSKTSVVLNGNEGEETYDSSEEVKELYESNRISFENKYFGTIVTITGEVTDIEGAHYNRNMGRDFIGIVQIDHFWNVEISESNPALEEIGTGDIVMVSGEINNELYDELYLYGDHQIDKVE